MSRRTTNAGAAALGLLLLIGSGAGCGGERRGGGMEPADGGGERAPFGECRRHADCPPMPGAAVGCFYPAESRCEGGRCAVLGPVTPGAPRCDASGPVCGCDGTTYPDRCEPERLGLQIAHDGPCN